MYNNFSNYKTCDLIRISSSAYRICLSHALTTEKEEIMGIYLGNVIESDNQQIIEIYSSVSLSRICKEKDRVELDEEQLLKAREYADELSEKHNLSIKIVGWYHSHPKITVPPSHVDLNTQFSQQNYGPFVGLIFSVFNLEDQNLSLQCIAFQTLKNNIAHYIGIVVEPDEILYYDKQVKKFEEITVMNSFYINLINNLVKEEEEESKKFEKTLKKIDYANTIILISNRQTLLVKILELICLPIIKSNLNIVEYEEFLIDFYDRANHILEQKIEHLLKLEKINN